MIRCAMCKKGIKRGEHYILRIATFSAREDIEINLLDLTRDFQKEIQDILKSLRHRRAKELEEEVFHAGEYHLCRSCRQRYKKNPFRNRRVTGNYS